MGAEWVHEWSCAVLTLVLKSNVLPSGNLELLLWHAKKCVEQCNDSHSSYFHQMIPVGGLAHGLIGFDKIAPAKEKVFFTLVCSSGFDSV